MQVRRACVESGEGLGTGPYPHSLVPIVITSDREERLRLVEKEDAESLELGERHP